MGDLKSTLHYIREIADDSDMIYILAAYNERNREIRARHAADMRSQLEKGDKVMVKTNIKPKYFAGQVGEVLSIQGDKVEVDFLRPIRRFNRIVKIPITSLKKIS